MDGFFSQLDRFLATLTPGAVTNLASELHDRAVLTSEEKVRVVEEDTEAARERLRTILHSKSDGVQLKALLQVLQAFKSLYKETKSKHPSGNL